MHRSTQGPGSSEEGSAGWAGGSFFFLKQTLSFHVIAVCVSLFGVSLQTHLSTCTAFDLVYFWRLLFGHPLAPFISGALAL